MARTGQCRENEEDFDQMVSFADRYPDLVPEWAGENEIRPEDVSYGSNKKIIWNGRCGHTWEATAKNRGNNHGCPYCSGNKVLKGVNDLATLFPELAAEWDESNRPLMPDMVSRKANREVTWKCHRCGQTWRSRIADRTDGHGCPVCAGEKLVGGINDFAAGYPDLAAEWSDRNEGSPREAWPKSRRNVWWRCHQCGHEWRAVINSRVKGSGCPECARRDRLERRPYHDAEGERLFKRGILAYYADKAGVRIKTDSDEEIGIALDTYFPDYKSAVIYSKPFERGRLVRRENARNWLCFKAGIKLFRIAEPGAKEYDNCICITLENKSYDVLSLAVQTAFDMIGLDADVDIERDMMEIVNFLKVAHQTNSQF